ncbi:NmrA family protein [Wallemia mellicola]|uniref:NmrA family protein n=1 Tax=Wallemia mellicola TaxID=1708541 RepID=A0A4T0MDP4_9BASI|nr:NmrA family protein [Wallemia mellicola]
MFLISGATGQQGGATIRNLKGVPTRAFIRNTHSEAAKNLSADGVELASGDLTNSESIYAAMEDVDGAFLVTTMVPNGPQDEIVQGKAFIEAAKRRNLKHIVYTSVEGAERQSGVPHFDSKYEVEKMIYESGIPYTIIRPVAFMDNFPKTSGVASFFAIGVFNAAIRNRTVQLIATEDIGIVAATALKKPEQYIGRKIPLAGDELTTAQIQDAYKVAHGSSAWKVYLPTFILSVLPYDFKKMFYWFRDHGYEANIAKNREEFPGLLTFSEWLKK